MAGRFAVRHGLQRAGSWKGLPSSVRFVRYHAASSAGIVKSCQHATHALVIAGIRYLPLSRNDAPGVLAAITTSLGATPEARSRPRNRQRIVTEGAIASGASAFTMAVSAMAMV